MHLHACITGRNACPIGGCNDEVQMYTEFQALTKAGVSVKTLNMYKDLAIPLFERHNLTAVETDKRCYLKSVKLHCT